VRRSKRVPMTAGVIVMLAVAGIRAVMDTRAPALGRSAHDRGRESGLEATRCPSRYEMREKERRRKNKAVSIPRSSRTPRRQGRPDRDDLHGRRCPLFLGSMTGHVVRYAKCAVLVVRNFKVFCSPRVSSGLKGSSTKPGCLLLKAL